MEDRTAASLYRGMIVFACLFACIAAVNYMQTLFDKGDLKRAMTVVRDFRGASGLTIQEAIHARHEGQMGGEITWDVGIESTFFGVMRATATVPLQGSAPKVYRFDVDLVRNGIHPADDHGRYLLRIMSEPPAPDAAPTAPTAPTTAPTTQTSAPGLEPTADGNGPVPAVVSPSKTPRSAP